MGHPYRENDEQQNRTAGTPRYAPASFGDLDDLVNRAVQFGSRVGGEVLGSISDALQEAMGRPAAPGNDLERTRKRLNSRLSDGQGGYMALGVLGWFFGGSFLIAFIVMAVLAGVAPAAAGVFTGQAIQVFNILAAVFAPVSIGFCALGWFGVHRANWYGRLRRYLKVTRGWTGTLAQIARDAVTDPRKVRKDLQRAVANGKLGSAYYDAETDVFYLDGSQYQPAPPPAPAAAGAAELTDAEKFARQGTYFLAYLRGCGGRLPEDAGAEIETMERTCGAIMGFIAAHPQQLPRVRRFAEYYLPTTRKLLDTALGLGDADAANAQTIRRDITGILHTLNTAYTKLYDTLLQDVSLDISTEIDTLETMLRQDGLTHDFASDFQGKQ